MAKKNRIPHPLIAQAKREIEAIATHPRHRLDRYVAYDHQPAGYSERLHYQLRREREGTESAN